MKVSAFVTKFKALHVLSIIPLGYYQQEN